MNPSHLVLELGSQGDSTDNPAQTEFFEFCRGGESVYSLLDLSQLVGRTHGFPTAFITIQFGFPDLSSKNCIYIILARYGKTFSILTGRAGGLILI